MAIKFQIKRSNTATWTSTNPTLAEGELGFETNTNKLKIGNGSNTWNTLSYIASGVIDFDTVSAANTSYISNGINHIRTAGYYTEGDGGGGLYKKVLSGSTGVGTPRFISNEGSIWELVEIYPNVKQYGAKGDGTDDSSAIQGAIDSLGAAGGTITIPIGMRCVVDQDLVIKSNITLKGPHAIVGTSNNNLSADYSNIGGALLVNSANTIRLKGGSALQGLLVHKKGMTFPAENSSLFSGTAVTIEGDDTAVFQSMILGFNQAIYSTGHQRLRLYDLNIDSVSGISIDNCADIAYMSRIHCWPFATIAALGPATSLQRSGTAYKFTTMGDWNKISECFSYGYFRGIWVDNCNSMTLLNCGADSTGSYSGQIGFLVTGTSTDTRIIGGQTAAQEIGYYIHTASNVHSRIIGTDSWACTNHGVFIDNGDVYISGGIHRDVPNAITNNNATNIVTIDGVRFSGISNIPINNTILNSNIRIGQNDYKNWGPGGSVANNTNLPVVSIASSDPISLPAYGEVFNITGNTSFGTINGGWAGRIIVLKFNDALTVFDGGESLKLKGNFSSIAEDTLTLAHNGAAWFEISRSTASIDFDTVSSVNSATISSSVNHIRTAGYYTTGDEGGANYTRYSTNGSTPAHGGYITSNGGQYVWEIDEVQPNIKQFGAKDDANFDSRTSIQNAINFGKSVFIPNGSYTVLDTLFCNNSGQLIQGESREKAVIFANGNFNTTTSNGIFVLRSYEPGPELRSFTIRCDQPNTSSRASLVSYPPAIYGDRDLFGSFTGQARTRIINMRIERAKTGIDLRGNAGGSTIDDLQISSFDYAIRLDESIDSVRLLSVHHWPFGFGTLTQLNNIFFDTDNIGLEVGRVDDLHVEGGLFIGGGNQMQFVSTEGGAGTFGRVTGTMFDTYGQLSCNNFNGFLTFQGCGFSLLPNNRSAIKLTGGSGSIRLTGCRFNNNEPLTVPLVEQNGASNLIMVGNIFNLPGSGEMTVIKTGSSVGDAAEAIIADNYFDIPPNINFATKNVVDVGAGTRITFTGNRIRDKGTGAGNFLNIVQDNHHVIIGNAFLNWNLVLPESFNDIVIRHNSSLPSSDIRSNRLVGREYVARYAAEANSGGNSIFSHGISDLNKKTIMTQAFFKEGSGNTKPCVIDYIDGTNIRVTGANANSNLVVTVVYTAVNDPRWG